MFLMVEFFPKYGLRKLTEVTHLTHQNLAFEMLALVFGANLSRALGCRFGQFRSTSAGSRRVARETQGTWGHCRVGGSSQTGATLEARTRQLVVESWRTPPDRWSGRDSNRSIEFDVGFDRGRRCQAQMRGETISDFLIP